VVLLDQIVEVFHLPQFYVFRQDASGFQVGNGLRIGRVLVDIDDTRSSSPGSRNHRSRGWGYLLGLRC
jgi:hypothetical protein